jgi:hypothetical protein
LRGSLSLGNRNHLEAYFELEHEPEGREVRPLKEVLKVLAYN